MLSVLAWACAQAAVDVGGRNKASEKMQEWAKLYLRFDVAKMKIVWVTATIVSTGMRRFLKILLYYTLFWDFKL